MFSEESDECRPDTELDRHEETYWHVSRSHQHQHDKATNHASISSKSEIEQRDILTVTFYFCSIALKPHWCRITLHIQVTIHLTSKRFWLAVIMLYHSAFLANYLMLLKIRWQQEQMKYAVTFIIIHSCPWSFSDIIKDKYYCICL